MSYQSLPPLEYPGRFSTVSKEAVRDALKNVARYGLYPIQLEPKEGYSDLIQALGKRGTKRKCTNNSGKDHPLSFSKIGK